MLLFICLLPSKHPLVPKKAFLHELQESALPTLQSQAFAVTVSQFENSNTFYFFGEGRRFLGPCLLRKQEQLLRTRSLAQHATVRRGRPAAHLPVLPVFRERSAILRSTTMENYARLSRDFS